MANSASIAVSKFQLMHQLPIFDNELVGSFSAVLVSHQLHGQWGRPQSSRQGGLMTTANEDGEAPERSNPKFRGEPRTLKACFPTTTV